MAARRSVLAALLAGALAGPSSPAANSPPGRSEENAPSERSEENAPVWSEEAAAHHNRGVAHLISNRFDQAAEAFAAAAKLAPPDAPEPRYNLALTLYRAQRSPEALAALAGLAGSARVEVLRGRLLRAGGDSRWLAAWQAARRTGSLDAPTLWHLLRLLSSAGRPAEALALLPDLARQGADAGLLDAERVSLAAEAGDLGSALAAFRRAAGALGREQPEIAARLAEAEAAAGDDPAASGRALARGANLLRATAAYKRALAALARRDARSPLSEEPLPLGLRPVPGSAPGALALLPERLPAPGARGLCRAGGGLLAVGEGGGVLYEPDPEGHWRSRAAFPEPALECAAADLDQDGEEDVVTVGEAELRVRWAGGQPPTRLAAAARSLVMFDYDRDGDADLASAGAAGTRLWRNNRDRSFSDVTRDSGLARLAPGPSVGALAADLSGGEGPDLLVLRAGAPDLLIASLAAHDPEVVPLGGGAAPAGAAAVADWNQDGYLDLVAGGRLHANQGPGRFAAAAAPGPPDAARLGAADLDLDGIEDLLALTSSGSLALWRGLGGGGFAPWPTAAPAAVGDALVLERGGRAALALLAREEIVWLESPLQGRSLPLGLRATKDNTHALGARVELWAGVHFARRDVALDTAGIGWEGPRVALGLGRRSQAQWVRITWPNRTWSSLEEPEATSAQVEQPRDLVGSCPFLYAWSGERFDFVADFLGGSPLGLPVGRGAYMPIDPDEHLLVPGSLLAPRDGLYELRITEELREILYLDHLRLVVADHPPGTRVASEDGLGGGGPATSRPLVVAGARPPRRAIDHHGQEVGERLAAVDGRYPDRIRWLSFQGFAEPHSLTLEFDPPPPGAEAVLLLTGGTYWSEAETFALSQAASLKAELPVLEVFRDGRWQDLLRPMPFPGGRAKTVAVALPGEGLGLGPLRLRMATNLRLYLDQVLLGGRSPTAADLRLAELAPARAQLSWRGYSAAEPFDGRLPRRYDYQRASSSAAGFGRFEGFFTRFGDVLPLLARPDDAAVVLHHGDQLALAFPVPAGPPPGWERDFFLRAVGWDKDGDAKTWAGRSVEPLPFRAMSGYPYGAGEAYPWSPELRALAREFQTRWISAD